jgi:hypothetical protein
MGGKGGANEVMIVYTLAVETKFLVRGGCIAFDPSIMSDFG